MIAELPHERPESPELPITNHGCFYAPDGCAATDTEVFLLTALMVRFYADMDGRTWQESVLTEDLNASKLHAAGEVWHPPWEGGSLQRQLTAALTKSKETLDDVIMLVKHSIGRTLGMSNVTTYLEKLRRLRLKGPAYRGSKSGGSVLHISAIVRVAHLLRDQGAALRDALAVAEPIAPSPTKEEKKEMHAVQMEQLKLEHEIEMENLQDTIEELRTSSSFRCANALWPTASNAARLSRAGRRRRRRRTIAGRRRSWTWRRRTARQWCG